MEKGALLGDHHFLYFHTRCLIQKQHPNYLPVTKFGVSLAEIHGKIIMLQIAKPNGKPNITCIKSVEYINVGYTNVCKQMY
jgi:hypothetical protein